MPNYNSQISRVGPGFDVSGTGDALVPEPLATSIIQELPKQSAALSLCKKTVLSTKTMRMPVLDVLPMAYWVGGDTGLKQTTNQQWKNVVMVVEELATIIPIPQAYLDDADVPIWDEVQPRMVEAAGALIDEAVIWNINKPATWGESIVGGALRAGNVVVDGYVDGTGSVAATDLGQSVTALGDKMSQTGYNINGFIGRPGLNWRLAGLRSEHGIPIYSSINTDMGNSSSLSGSLYGFPIAMPDNGAYQAETAQLITGDWNKAIIGVRQDIGFKLFTEGVISDANGAVILNLMQQDAVAMRMVMRLAYATVNPVTVMQPNKAITVRWPFGVVASSVAAAGGTPYPRADTGSGTTSGSVVVTDTNSLATDVGRSATGTGIPTGSYVAGVVAGTSLSLNNAATATAASVTVTVGASYGTEEPDEAEEVEEVEEAPEATTPARGRK